MTQPKSHPKISHARRCTTSCQGWRRILPSRSTECRNSPIPSRSSRSRRHRRTMEGLPHPHHPILNIILQARIFPSDKGPLQWIPMARRRSREKPHPRPCLLGGNGAHHTARKNHGPRRKDVTHQPGGQHLLLDGHRRSPSPRSADPTSAREMPHRANHLQKCEEIPPDLEGCLLNNFG